MEAQPQPQPSPRGPAPTGPRALKTTDKATYIREYKRKRYTENPTSAREYNRAQYYRSKYGCSQEEWEEYKTKYPQVYIIRKNLDQLLKTDIEPDFIKKLLEPYVSIYEDK